MILLNLKFIFITLYSIMSMPVEKYYFISTNLISINNIHFYLNLEVDRSHYFPLILRLTHNITDDIINNDFKIIIVDNNSVTYDYKFNFLDGYSISTLFSSSAVGYLKDNKFYGKFLIDFNMYVIDEIELHTQLFDSTKNAVVYLQSQGFGHFQNIIEEVKFKRAHAIYDNQEKIFYRKFIGHGRICTLAVIIDHSYLCKEHKNDMNSAVAKVKESIETANSIFRATDFNEDGYPDNVGFKIKQIIIIRTHKSSFNLIPSFTKTSANGNIFINRLSHYQFLNDVCLGVLFSAQPFENQVLGLSYTGSPNQRHFAIQEGGICDKLVYFMEKRATNSLLVSTGKMKKTNKDTFDLALTHELGHSFGALHDETRECKNYIMHPTSRDGNDPIRYKFSSCSKKSIFKTILSKGYCLETEPDSFCGNGIVEKGEECDCGTIQTCAKGFKCCNPRGFGSDSCKTTKDCDPSQGPCCNLNCTINDLSDVGLDCKDFFKTCPCTTKENTCFCGIQGVCIGEKCHSVECTRINLKECICPYNEASKSCGTCCLKENLCQPSMEITEKLCKTDKNLIKQLQKYKGNIKYEKPYSVQKTFCKESICVKLFFRQVGIGEFCLQNGLIGICNNNNECILSGSEIFLLNSENQLYFSKVVFCLHLICYILF